MEKRVHAGPPHNPRTPASLLFLEAPPLCSEVLLTCTLSQCRRLPLLSRLAVKDAFRQHQHHHWSPGRGRPQHRGAGRWDGCTNGQRGQLLCTNHTRRMAARPLPRPRCRWPLGCCCCRGLRLLPCWRERPTCNAGRCLGDRFVVFDQRRRPVHDNQLLAVPFKRVHHRLRHRRFDGRRRQYPGAFVDASHRNHPHPRVGCEQIGLLYDLVRDVSSDNGSARRFNHPNVLEDADWVCSTPALHQRPRRDGSLACFYAEVCPVCLRLEPSLPWEFSFTPAVL